MRFARGVEDLRAAVSLHRRQQDVLGPGHGREIEHDAVAVQLVGGGNDLVIRLGYLRPHLTQTPQMLLEAARTDVVAARTWNAGSAKSREERPEEDDRCTHPAPELIGYITSQRGASVKHDCALAFGLTAQLAHDIAHDRDIGHARHVVEGQWFGSQQRCRHLRQSGIFRTAHTDIACQLSAAGDPERPVATGEISLHRMAKASRRILTAPSSGEPQPRFSHGERVLELGLFCGGEGARELFLGPAARFLCARH